MQTTPSKESRLPSRHWLSTEVKTPPTSRTSATAKALWAQVECLQHLGTVPAHRMYTRLHRLMCRSLRLVVQRRRSERRLTPPHPTSSEVAVARLHQRTHQRLRLSTSPLQGTPRRALGTPRRPRRSHRHRLGTVPSHRRSVRLRRGTLRRARRSVRLPLVVRVTFFCVWSSAEHLSFDTDSPSAFRSILVLLKSLIIPTVFPSFSL